MPNPGLSDRRRVVLGMLAADPPLRVAWTCADDGGDPVTLTLAIRDKGTCDLAIPCERFDALALPGLIDAMPAQHIIATKQHAADWNMPNGADPGGPVRAPAHELLVVLRDSAWSLR